MRVLYLEDNPLDAGLTRRDLARNAPYIALDVAATLSEAREKVASNINYDLVLADLNLPDGTGLELLDEIRQQALPVAVVILTGLGDEETAVAALKLGADDYLVKREDYLAQLPAALNVALERFRTESSRKAAKLHVLYAERSEHDIDLTKRHISRFAQHIDLEIVHNADQILSRLADATSDSHPYDVVLLDYRLPGLNALEVLKAVRLERQLDLPVVMVTGQGNEEIAAQALRLGATDYLVKHEGYLYELPSVLENAFNQVQLSREQAALRESEARFRRLAENAQDIITRITVWPQLAVSYMSPAVKHILGYRPKAFYDDPNLLQRLVHHEDSTKLSAILAGKVNYDNSFELRFEHKRGHTIWIEQRVVPIYDQQHHLVALEAIARDITERVEAEALLRKKTEELDSFFENALDMLCISDTDGVFRRLNPQWEQTLGYSARELQERRFFDIVHPEDNRATRELLKRLDSQEEVIDFVNRCRTKDGSYRWIEWRSFPAGKLVYSAARDITERVNSAQQLQLQGAALNAAANAIMIASKENIVQWVNPAFTTLTGYAPQEAIGKSTVELIRSGIHTPAFYTKIEETLSAGSPWQGEMINRRKDGSLYSEEQTVTPLLDDNGQITHYITIKQDITQRKLAEQERTRLMGRIREQARSVQQIVDTVPVGVVLLTEQGNVEVGNPLAMSILKDVSGTTNGKPVTEFGGVPLAELLNEQEIGQWKEIAAGTRIFEVAAHPIKQGPNIGRWVLVLQDVTEERDRRRYHEAQERLATVGQLAAGIAHDFNNVMGIIILYSQLLGKMVDLPEKASDYLQTIHEQARHAANLIAQILDFSRSSVLDVSAMDLLPLV